MISDINVDWESLTKADMYTIIKQTEEQNAKLRELIKELYTDMWDSGEWLEPYEQRMRELGVEVD